MAIVYCSSQHHVLFFLQFLFACLLSTRFVQVLAHIIHLSLWLASMFYYTSSYLPIELLLPSIIAASMLLPKKLGTCWNSKFPKTGKSKIQHPKLLIDRNWLMYHCSQAAHETNYCNSGFHWDWRWKYSHVSIKESLHMKLLGWIVFSMVPIDFRFN